MVCASKTKYIFVNKIRYIFRSTCTLNVRSANVCPPLYIVIVRIFWIFCFSTDYLKTLFRLHITPTQSPNSSNVSQAHVSFDDTVNSTFRRGVKRKRLDQENYYNFDQQARTFKVSSFLRSFLNSSYSHFRALVIRIATLKLMGWMLTESSSELSTSRMKICPSVTGRYNQLLANKWWPSSSAPGSLSRAENR